MLCLCSSCIGTITGTFDVIYLVSLFCSCICFSFVPKIVDHSSRPKLSTQVPLTKEKQTCMLIVLAIEIISIHNVNVTEMVCRKASLVKFIDGFLCFDIHKFCIFSLCKCVCARVCVCTQERICIFLLPS